MRCDEIQERFSAILDQELPTHEADVVRRHLDACHDCQQHWQAFQQTLAWLASLEMAPPPADLMPAIRARMARRTWWQRLVTWPAQPWTGDFLVQTAGAFALALLAVVTLKSALQSPSLPGIPAQERLATARPSTGDAGGPRPRPVVGVVPVPMQPVPMPGFSLARSATAAGTAGELTGSQAPDPDLVLMVGTADPQLRSELRSRLYLEGRWQVQPVRRDLFLVRLRPDDLHELRQLLGEGGLKAFPPESLHPAFGCPRETITVALRLD
ncbi:MAG: zf-HC2 domain-containing protein [Thermodesulfobacteriota bacterium]